MFRRIACIACLVALLITASFAPAAPASSQPSTQPSYTRRQDVVYGRLYGTALTMDVFRPTGERNRAIIVFDKLKSCKVDAELVVREGKGHGWLDVHDDIQRCADWFDAHLFDKHR